MEIRLVRRARRCESVQGKNRREGRTIGNLNGAQSGVPLRAMHIIMVVGRRGHGRS
jgi:hypothetical protein